jgi:hypothetical protein
VNKPNSKVKGFIARQKEDMKAVREMMDYAKELLTEATHPTPTISEIKKKFDKEFGIFIEHGYKGDYEEWEDGRDYAPTPKMIWNFFLPYLTAGSKKGRGLRWEGTIGGDPHNPFPLKGKK